MSQLKSSWRGTLTDSSKGSIVPEPPFAAAIWQQPPI